MMRTDDKEESVATCSVAKSMRLAGKKEPSALFLRSIHTYFIRIGAQAIAAEHRTTSVLMTPVARSSSSRFLFPVQGSPQSCPLVRACEFILRNRRRGSAAEPLLARANGWPVAAEASCQQQHKPNKCGGREIPACAKTES